MSDTKTATRASVFINASSGWDAKEDAPERLRSMFEAAGIEAAIEHVQAGVNLAGKSREAVVSGADLVVAGGGDGTISAVAAGVAGSETCLGVLPVGTLNHFARDLKIPLDLEAAAEIVVNGETSCVDVGEVNGKIFINNSIIGLYPIYRFLKARHEERVGNKRLAFLMAAAGVVRRYPLLKIRLHVDGSELTRKTPYVLIANNRHAMDGYHLGLRDSLTEGKLWIYIMRDRGRWGLFRLLAKLATGRFKGEEDFEIFPAEDVWVETNPGKKAGVALDGEVTALETPLHYRILPRALNVKMPGLV
jgi:YegS/Rv2252/BmrU family lipid kinase